MMLTFMADDYDDQDLVKRDMVAALNKTVKGRASMRKKVQVGTDSLLLDGAHVDAC
jgi:hypothetical protein